MGCSDKWAGHCLIATLLVLTVCVYQGFRKNAVVLEPLSAAAVVKGVLLSPGALRLHEYPT